MAVVAQDQSEARAHKKLPSLDGYIFEEHCLLEQNKEPSRGVPKKGSCGQEGKGNYPQVSNQAKKERKF